MRECWCANTEFLPFSLAYSECPACGTLVLQDSLSDKQFQVKNDEADFYGMKYWSEHQEKELGLPNIEARARADLPERCLHWLHTALQYKLPPGHILELGSAHGGFVALLRWAGFYATGLEMSPHVVEFSRRTFDVPILLGPIENQKIEPSTYDIIVLMDVLEHLPDPVGTMNHCLTLLKTDGLVFIQTPRYQEGRTYEEMVAQNDPFLALLQETGHLYMFSPKSIRMFFKQLNIAHLNFEPAIFSHYDMFLVASREPLKTHSSKKIEEMLLSTPSGRLILALFDLYFQKKILLEKYLESEMDRAARWEQIEKLTLLLQEKEKVLNSPGVKLCRKLSGFLKKLKVPE